MLSRYTRKTPFNIALYSPDRKLIPSTQNSASGGMPLQPLIPPEDRVVITLVGAGRGPLILCSLRAAMKAKRDIVVYAIEKNPNAIITLQTLHSSLKWGEKVRIVETDMRVYRPEYYSDIILSELLGSFSDNELSPECLIGAQRFLLFGGEFIPRESTSFLTACMSSRIYNRVWLEMLSFCRSNA